MPATKCFYSPGYFVPLPEGHPFPVEKYAQTHHLLTGIAPGGAIEWKPVKPAPMDSILRVHSADYIESVRMNTLTPFDRNRLGLPHHPRFLERSQLDCQGTIEAARSALQTGVLAWNVGGGTHHAMADTGLGFCITNDVAVAIADLRQSHPDLRVLVLDTDAHQGNGTHKLLREDRLSVTFSIHVGRNYPAQKEPGDWDVPLERYCSGSDYLKALDQALKSLFALGTFDLIFWVSGVDVHEHDRFGQMRLSDRDIADRDEQVFAFAQRMNSPLVGTLGGGYHREIERVPEMHAQCVLRSIQGLCAP
jgi:acetoin utilization deacetylase AcuC-like enzyme